jgi:hypothetical protein
MDEYINFISNTNKQLKNEILKDEVIKEGYIYIIYNNMYMHNGDNIFKLGKTQDIGNRLKAYTTSYIMPCEIRYLSEKCINYSLAEKIIFDKLKLFRIKLNREFFQGNINYFINIIEQVIENINNLLITSYKLEKSQNKCNKQLFKNSIIIEDKKQLFNNSIIIEDKKQLRLLLKDKMEISLLFNDNILEKYYNLRLLLKERIDENIEKKSRCSKIKICKEIMKILEIDKLELLNKDVTSKFNNILNNDWLKENLNIIKKTFKIRTSKYNNFIYYNIYTLLITLLKNLFDVNLFIKKVIHINNIQYKYYILNKEVLLEHIKIIEKINNSDLFIDEDIIMDTTQT